jgi:cytochrome c553
MRSAGLAALAGAVALMAFELASAEPDPMQDYAHRLAVGVCGTCHGVRGNGTQPKFPRLAGQNAGYLAAQLRNFRGQTRGDSDAIGYMWGMAQPLNDATIDALAKYYAALTPIAGKVRESSQIQRGREIYLNGIASEGVPACASCHGPDAHGLQQYPRLAGQHAQYILKQLASFQSNMRDVAIMHGVAQNLRDPEMESVAAFLEAQP